MNGNNINNKKRTLIPCFIDNFTYQKLQFYNQNSINWIDQETKSIYLLFIRNTFCYKDRYCLRVKGWTKGPQLKAIIKGFTILIFNKTGFKLKLIRRDNEGNSILITGAVN